MRLREILGRIAAWRNRDDLDRDLGANLELHVDLVARDLEAEGMSREAARAAARRRVGSITRLREESRDAWGFPALDSLALDVRYALRGLRRSPAFAVTIITTIALGIGAATSTFTVVDGVLLKAPPYADPERLVSIYTVFPHFRGRPTTNDIWNVLRTPFPDYVRYRDAQHSLSDVAGFNIGAMSVTLGDQTDRIPSAQASPNLLKTLGVGVARGRWFATNEEGQGSPRLAVLSHRLWQERFGSAEDIVGRTITLDELPYEVIGVLNPSFVITGKPVGTERDIQPDVWIPIGANGRGFEPGNHTLDLIGRLRPGITVAAASAEVEPILRGTANPERRSARIVPRLDVEVGAMRRPLWLLFGAVAVFLAITCGNVASLFLSECAARSPEFRTRLVLGAGRARLTRLVLTQSLVVAGAGAAGGIALAWFGTKAMLALAPAELPHAAQIGLDVRVLLFTVAVAFLMAIASGLAPAIMLGRDSRGPHGLAGGRVVAGRSRVQLLAIATQAAGAVVLLVGAGLLARSLFNESEVDPGFRAGNSFQMQISLPRSMTPTPDDTRRLQRDIARVLREVPGVTSVTGMSSPPLSGRVNGQIARPMPLDDSRPAVNVGHAVVMYNYFDAMRIHLLAGRSFSSTDTIGAEPVAVISEGMARLFWSVEGAVGKQFKHPNGVATVIGVAADVRNKALTTAAEPLFYLASQQSSTPLTFIMHTSGDPIASVPAAQHAVWNAVPGTTIAEVATSSALMSRALAPSRYRAALATIFASLAMVMTLVGIAGLTLRAVAFRRNELCIRMALGATASSARALAIRAPVVAALAGALAGTATAMYASRWLAEYLFEVRARDAMTYVSTAGLIAGASLLAAFIATRSVKRAELATTLRNS